MMLVKSYGVAYSNVLWASCLSKFLSLVAFTITASSLSVKHCYVKVPFFSAEVAELAYLENLGMQTKAEPRPNAIKNILRKKLSYTV